MKALTKALKMRMLTPVARHVKTEKLTYLSHSKLRSMARCLKNIEKKGIPGDIYEFGIALGGSSIILAQDLEERRFHGYDVFEMIPPPREADDQKTHDRYSEIVSGTSKGIDGDPYYGYESNLYDRVVENMARFDLIVDGAKICLHKGLFEDTVSIPTGSKIALAHIDCDWFEPVAFCLDAVAPHVSPGGMIILDDYNDYDGCRKATDAFLTENQNYALEQTRAHAVLVRSE